MICTQGTVESTQFGSCEVLYADQVLFTNVAVPHASRYCIDGKPSRGVTIEFSPAVLKRLGYSCASGYLQAYFVGKLYMPQAAGLARRIEEEASHANRDTVLMVTAIARQIVAHVLREWPRPLVLPSPDRTVSYLPRHELVRSIELMNVIPSNEFNIPYLARKLHRSTSTFSRLFVRSVGASPHSYYRALLLEHAADLLLSTNQPIKQVALELGLIA